MSELAKFIQSTPMADTHEHLVSEQEWVENGPDVLGDLFGMYIGNDLLTAGAPLTAVQRLLDSSDPDIAGRWQGVQAAWQHCQHTGYGRAVRQTAKMVYQIDEINLATIEAAAALNAQMRQPGERLRLLQEVANLDYVQIDNFVWACEKDPSGPDFFFYDMSWANFVNGNLETAALQQEVGIEVVDLASLRQALEGLFACYGETAVAVKSQHAYERTLFWEAREDAVVEVVLQKQLKGEELSKAEKLCLGDWCLAQGAALAADYKLPFKIHTGYLAGNDFYVQPLRTHPAGLAPLINAYPATCFVLMHMAYPYSDDLIAIAKHFPNVYVDMCWGWALNPYHAADFVRRLLHAVPANKLFAFGGDTFSPTGAVAFAAQARHWLTYALQSEVDEGFLSEPEAVHLAGRFILENQRDCFRKTAKSLLK